MSPATPEKREIPNFPPSLELPTDDGLLFQTQRVFSEMRNLLEGTAADKRKAGELEKYGRELLGFWGLLRTRILEAKTKEGVIYADRELQTEFRVPAEVRREISVVFSDQERAKLVVTWPKADTWAWIDMEYENRDYRATLNGNCGDAFTITKIEVIGKPAPSINPSLYALKFNKLRLAEIRRKRVVRAEQFSGLLFGNESHVEDFTIGFDWEGFDKYK